MRILIDEDTAVQLVDPLRRVLVGHDVAHVAGLSWKGKKDLQVLPDAKQAGYQMLITRDKAQFSDPRECDAIKKSGLHHVRYAQRQGPDGLALAVGGIIAAMPMVVHDLENSSGQRLVLITAIDTRRRYGGLRSPKTTAVACSRGSPGCAMPLRRRMAYRPRAVSSAVSPARSKIATPSTCSADVAILMSLVMVRRKVPSCISVSVSSLYREAIKPLARSLSEASGHGPGNPGAP
jgi:hypothetical protein